LLIFTGLVGGFGHSPYSHRLEALLGNILYLVTMLVGIELSRAYLMALFGRRYTLISLVFVSLLFTFISTPLGAYTSLQSIQETIRMLGESLLPTFSENLLASFLALLGGPLASIAYRGSLLAFEWLSPILPNPGWFISALFGTLFPAYGMLFLYNQLPVKSMKEKSEEYQGNTTMAWAIAAGFTLAILGFTTGLFGVKPTLIASGSMSPYLNVGDIVVIRETPVETLVVGDVVSVRTPGLPVIHRVVDIREAGGQKFFTTRGDDNDTDDAPVPSEAIQGKAVFIIPKIGWASIYLRQIISGAF
jgi:signal peptidase